MDPDACYAKIREAMEVGDFDTAREKATSLKEWLSRGGFYPHGCTTGEVDSYLLQVLFRTAVLPDA